MKAIGGVIALVVVFAAFITLGASAYVVRVDKQVVITQFGKPVGDAVTDPGLHFRTPFVQDVNAFDKRLLDWDGAANEIPTADKRFIWVDTTARWRIVDPLLFMQTVRTPDGAQSRLDDIIDSATRDQISAQKMVEVVRNSNRVLDVEREETGEDDLALSSQDIERVDVGRDKIAARILAAAQPLATQYGIELKDVRLKRITYRKDVQEAVYARMISERNRIAERYRSEGQGRKAEVMGERDREQKKISSEAERLALEIMARADATAARVYAEAYNTDPEFYAFWRTLDTYRTVVGDNHTLVVSPDSELYRLLLGGGTATAPR
jgi:membrane protease subunit HflC